MIKSIVFFLAIILMGLLPTSVAANTTWISTRQATHITPTSARVAADFQLANPNTILEIGILLSTNQHDINNNVGTRVPTLSPGSSSFEVELPHLIPGVQYFAKAYVRYRAGASVFAQESIVFDPTFITFTTGGVAGVSVGRPQATLSGDNTTLESTINAGAANITARGFAVSHTHETPVIGTSNTIRLDSSQHTNTWFTSVTNTSIISRGRRYFVRAFVQLSNGQFIYSDTLILDGHHNQGTAFQGINTRSAAFANLIISMRGGFNASQFSNVSERGFVVSSAHSTPTTGNGTRVPTNNALETSTDNIAADWSIGSTASVYYVRAYVIQNGTPHYGNVVRVEIGTEAPVVFTRSAHLQDGAQARVVIDVIRAGRSSVIERGIVYSDTVATPQNMRANVQSRSISGSLGEGEVIITGLVPGARYFIRAFARNEQGTSYGQVVELLAVAEDAVVTLEPAPGASGQINARGRISLNQGLIREKGFVYSATNQTPTTANDTRVSTTAVSQGDFTLPITGLQASTTYHIRAYVTTEAGTIYGNVVSASPGAQEIQIAINFQNAAGQSVGTQTITAQIGQTLNAAALTPPSGYELSNQSWSHNVAATLGGTTTASLNVVVNPIARAEAAFIAGTGNRTFSPNRATTRAEVAQVIYNLSQNNGPASTPMSFSDVPINHPNRRAIDYVSSRLYMRGYPDGSFRPEATITRAEMTVVLTHVYNLLTAAAPPGAAIANFSDVASGFWGYRYISLAFAHRMIYGYPDGTFLPGNDITRAEVTTLFVNAEGRSRQPLGSAQFSDVPPNHWAFEFVMNAAVPH